MASAQNQTNDSKGPTPPEWQQQRVAELQELFPEAFSEGKVDLEKLQAALGEDVETRPERYSFSWAGKRDAMLLLQTPSRATLVPDHAESVQFENTGNIFIEGENLEVLKLLYKSYFGRVKMIYIDPPYNTGNDFIYPDNYTDPLDTYLKLTGQKDGNGNLLTSNPETSGRYHSVWLSMMYPRLFLARQLLSEDGVIFVSIDDHEVHNLRMLMNEVFGEENFFAQIVVQSNKGGQDYLAIAKTHEYMLCYAKNPDEEGLFELQKKGSVLPLVDGKGAYEVRELRNRNPKFNRSNRPNLYYAFYVNPAITDENGYCAVSIDDANEYSIEVFPRNSLGEDSCWRWGKTKVRDNLVRDKPSESQVIARQTRGGSWNVYEKSRRSTQKAKTLWDETEVRTEAGTRELRELFKDTVLDHPKPVYLIKKALETGIKEGLVLDFFAGSGTTAHAVLELNKEGRGSCKFILVQLPEPTGRTDYPTIADIGKERIRRVIKKLKEEKEGRLALETGSAPEDLGFKVFKLATSNYRSWTGVPEGTPQAYGDQIALYADPLVEGWTAENVLYEVAIREGYGLNCGIEQVQGIEGNTVYRVTDTDKGQWFHICLDDALHPETLKGLELTADHLFICRDKALDDEAAANLALQCRLKTI